MTAKDALENLSMCMHMMMADRADEAEVCFQRTLDYLNHRIEVEKKAQELRDFVKEGDEYYGQ